MKYETSVFEQYLPRIQVWQHESLPQNLGHVLNRFYQAAIQNLLGIIV